MVENRHCTIQNKSLIEVPVLKPPPTSGVLFYYSVESIEIFKFSGVGNLGGWWCEKFEVC